MAYTSLVTRRRRFSLKIYVRHPDNLAPFLNIRLDDVGELTCERYGYTDPA